MKKKLILATVIVIALFMLLCNIVKATYFYELGEIREEIQHQLEDATVEIEKIEINITKTLEDLNALNDKIASYESDINTLELDLIDIYNNIVIVEEKLENIKKDYQLQKTSFEKRLVTIYEAGETHYLDVLLKSNSLSDFISNYFLISELANYDAEILDNIAREKRLIDTMKETLESKMVQLKATKDSRERTIIALENTKVIKDEYVKKLSVEEKETQEKIDKFRAEIDRIDQIILMLSMQDIDSEYVGGVLAWPAPGWTTITSPFGMRVHPIFRIWRMHSGVDVATPTGVRIVAANDGVVVRSEYTEGYGNVIMINHGGGIMTVYGHGSELVSKVGDEVKRGDTVMKAGSTRMVNRTTFTFRS